MNLLDIDDIAGRFDITREEAFWITCVVQTMEQFIQEWSDESWWKDDESKGVES
jgi:hypothetical protein